MCSSDLDGIQFANPGIYNVQISVQLLNFTTSDDNVTLWFAQNGVDLSASASIVDVPSKHGTAPGAAILALNIFFQIATNDVVSLKWTSDSGNSVIATYPPGTSPVHPSSPAVILTAQFVSALPT